MRFDRSRFESLVAEAVDGLPNEILAWLDNVAIVVGERPTAEQLAQAGLGRNRREVGERIESDGCDHGIRLRGRDSGDSTPAFATIVERAQPPAHALYGFIFVEGLAFYRPGARPHVGGTFRT